MLNFIKKIKARRMNKIVEEVRQELLAEFLLMSWDGMKNFVDERIDGQVKDMKVPEIDYNELGHHIDYSEVAYHADNQEIADYISVDDIAYNIDVSDIAGYIDTDDIAQHFDHYTLAQKIDLADVVSELNIDDMLDDVRRDVLGEVEGMISDALDDLEITRG